MGFKDKDLFSFYWKGKEESLNTLFFGREKEPELEKIAEFGEEEYVSNNMVIVGDSLLSLKYLLKDYKGRVDIIYIDPPYNTGNRFTYNDDFKIKNRKKIDYNAKKYFDHSLWLSFIYPRLFLSRDLLKENGLIFISIDDNEYHHLRLLLDEIYGEENYVSTFCWINNLKGRQIVGSGPAKTYEYIVVYAKNIKKIGPFKLGIQSIRNIKGMDKLYGNFNYKLMKDEHGYFIIKNQLYNSNSLFNEETRPNLVFNIHYNFITNEIKFSEINENINYDGFVKIEPVRNNDGIHRFRAWRWSKEKIINEKHNLLFIAKNDKVRIYTKIRDINKTILKNIIFIPGHEGKKELSNILVMNITDYPKPVKLIKLILSITDKNSLILDFFAGSGTTGHAVWEINKDDGGNRKFILVQSEEEVKNDNIKNKFKSIDNICIERLKKIMNFYGTGFSVFKVIS